MAESLVDMDEMVGKLLGFKKSALLECEVENGMKQFSIAWYIFTEYNIVVRVTDQRLLEMYIPCIAPATKL